MKFFKYFIPLCFIILFSLVNALCAEEEITRAEFIKQLTESMGITYKLPEGPQILDYVNLLRKEGIKLPPDYDASKTITKEEKSDLLSQALAIERKMKEEGREVLEVYRNKAIIIRLTGEVMIKREGETEWIPAKTDMELTQGDYIKTGKGSSALLRVGVAGRIEVKENSEMLLRTLATQADKKSENILLYLAMGEILVDVREIEEKSRFETHTPTTVAAVRGTIYIVKVEPLLGKTEIREQ